MEITVAGQTWLFLLSAALGAALGVCYDVFRILRIAFRHPATAVLVEDILFSLTAAGATFAFLLTTGNGQLRAFFLIGELVGFSLYYCTLGALLIGAAKGIIAGLRWFFGLIYRVFVAPILRLVKKIRGFLAKIMKQSAKCIKNKAKNSRIPLKKHRHLLYNLKKRLQWDGRKKNKKEQEQPGS